MVFVLPNRPTPTLPLHPPSRLPLQINIHMPNIYILCPIISALLFHLQNNFAQICKPCILALEIPTVKSDKRTKRQNFESMEFK